MATATTKTRNSGRARVSQANAKPKATRVRKCRDKNAAGGPCGAKPLKAGTEIEGVKVTGKWCRQHDQDLPSSAKIHLTRTPEQMGGRPKNPKPAEIKQQLMERYQLAVQRPYWQTLGYDVKIDDDGNPYLVELEEGGAKIYGQSKDGETILSEVEDLGAQINACEKLEDRVYGKPKSSSEVVIVTRDAIEQSIIDMEAEMSEDDQVAA